MTDSESRQQQQSSNNAGHDLLGHLHDYHSSSPTFEYSYFTGEQAQLSIPVIPGIPVTEQAPIAQRAPVAPIAPVASCAPALQVPPVPQLAPAPAAQATEPAPQWSESSEKDRWIAFAQHEQTRIRDEKRTQEAERERQACHSGMQFSAGFNFHESLAKIFWRTDCDRSNRLDQAELTRALSERWFQNDEETLVRLLLHHYDTLVPSRSLADGGVSIGQILESPLFKEMADEHMQRLCPPAQSQNGTGKRPTTERLRLPNMMGRR